MLKQFVIVVLLLTGGAAFAEEAPKPALVIGTEWIMRSKVTADDTIHLHRYRVDRRDIVRGRPSIVITRGNIQAWLAEDTLALMHVTRRGKIVDSFDPDWQDWSWPLFVGKSWTSGYIRTLGDAVQGPARARWTVEAYEDVAVPAGTFKAFRLQRTPDSNTTHIETRWYAPDVGLMIKQVFAQAGRAGEIVEELDSYTKP